jgi:oxygen-dependent protoporphyrinogen oxidase
MKRVVIVGAGIAGLSVAEALCRHAEAPGVLVLERNARAGGNIRSEQSDGFLCEAGPNGFLDNAPETLALVDRLGLADRLLVSNDESRRRFVYCQNRLHPVPASPAAFIKSRLLSSRGKLRVLLEPLARGRPDTDETIHAFAARRIGGEAAARLIDPMVSGIFGGDARQLSLKACFPKMAALETRYGGLFRALWALSRERRRSRHVSPVLAETGRAAMGMPAGRLTSFRGGMEELIAGFVRTLPGRVWTSAPVSSVGDASHGDPAGRATAAYHVDVGGIDSIEADAVVLAGPAEVSARLVTALDDRLAQSLCEIPDASLAVVCLGYDRRDLNPACDLNGFGFLVPRSERVRPLGVLWESSIYAGRAPAGAILIRAMVGGATDPNAATFDECDLITIVRHALVQTMGISARPVFTRVFRHRRGIPQYTVGHLERMARIEEGLTRHPGLFVAGSSYRGVSMNACIEDGQKVAASVLAHLRTVSDSTNPNSEKRSRSCERSLHCQ